jgi:hypothetical protein
LSRIPILRMTGLTHFGASLKGSPASIAASSLKQAPCSGFA